ncbi:glycosyltransferase family 4 protein [Flavobacterium sp. ASW18X]|uniref:glycosyltransferase family 4 protein n=1 Tax=Flavobacterium sp. ASW18X TaxID=2572595 RepID=UPI0010AE7F92|nr:glycosyltransferase family 4 protein [Flavobacterium sp. ASW18X]TKD66188.1 glycosyltransferase family 4 protein [Flavobacterium sp. ASW18X]
MQKVLIIAYYWPPAGGPGVQRWLNFVKYLPEFGIEPIVYVPENPTYPIQDERLAADIPKEVTILKQPIFEPYGLAALFGKKQTKQISFGLIPKQKKQTFLERLLLWIRGNLFIPDARKFWVKPSVKYLTGIIKQQQITTLITTGPPHSVHLIGQKLKRKSGVTWWADFRDPWTTIGYHKKLKLTRLAANQHKRLERQILLAADGLLVTSDKTKLEFQNMTKTPIHVLTNGYEIEPKPTILDQKFTLAHIGSLLTDRNPIALWQALSELVKENYHFAQELQLNLIGVVGEDIKDSLAFYQLEDYVTYLGYLGHEEVLEHQAKSQVLLLLEIDSPETQGIIPGKLFEYLIAKRPILAIGPKYWEAGERVERHQAGRYHIATDKDGIKENLVLWFNAFQNQSLEVNPINIAQYHRKALTKRLAQLLAWA